MIRSVHRLGAVLLFGVVVSLGCGGSESTGPKESLNEQEKKQVEDLNKQRQKEWSGPEKKK